LSRTRTIVAGKGSETSDLGSVPNKPATSRIILHNEPLASTTPLGLDTKIPENLSVLNNEASEGILWNMTCSPHASDPVVALANRDVPLPRNMP
jgi:hypothetical protein